MKIVASEMEEERLEVADGPADETAEKRISVVTSEVEVEGLEVADGPVDDAAENEN